MTFHLASKVEDVLAVALEERPPRTEMSPA